jgi:hypothetical protein
MRMQSSLESDVAQLLTDLLAGQDQLLVLLGRRRELLAAVDPQGLAAVAAEEERLLATLHECLGRRERLLAQAADDGLPSASLQALAETLPAAQRGPLGRQIAAAGARARLLQHQSLINWVVIQRTLIHLSQLLEIIATGGRLQPTYGQGKSTRASGALVDREA